MCTPAYPLTHWDQDKMTTILQIYKSNSTPLHNHLLKVASLFYILPSNFMIFNSFSHNKLLLTCLHNLFNDMDLGQCFLSTKYSQSLLCECTYNSLKKKTPDHSAYELSHWEMMLQCNIVFHWLSLYTEWRMSLPIKPAQSSVWPSHQVSSVDFTVNCLMF